MPGSVTGVGVSTWTRKKDSAPATAPSHTALNITSASLANEDRSIEPSNQSPKPLPALLALPINAGAAGKPVVAAQPPDHIVRRAAGQRVVGAAAIYDGHGVLLWNG